MEQIFQTASPGITIAVTSVASTAALLPVTDVLDSIDQGMVQIRVVNEGPNIAFLSIGKTGATATLPAAGATKTCDAVLAGADIILTLSPSHRYISAICRASGTATLSVYVGRGQ